MHSIISLNLNRVSHDCSLKPDTEASQGARRALGYSYTIRRPVISLGPVRDKRFELIAFTVHALHHSGRGILCDQQDGTSMDPPKGLPGVESHSCNGDAPRKGFLAGVRADPGAPSVNFFESGRSPCIT